ncbi:MAG TPA: c-type cytochrome [Alphaproteobacteria bacterium]|jgi:cytochrome c oxidase cbb3-type subunit 3|nr:c-type cytochrome [Alphaproteobacteria bacterium]
MYSRFLRNSGLAAALIVSLAGSAWAQGAPGSTAVTTLFPGGGSAPPPDPRGAQYDRNPQAIAEGSRLFDWYNCSGCHFHGAGGIGPALMDDVWIYGGSIDQIYASIYQGRPNGMPSWAHKIPDDKIWEIAAYVRSLSTATAANGPDQPTPSPPSPPAAEPQQPTPQTTGPDAKK